jgi:hypothetical protein
MLPQREHEEWDRFSRALILSKGVLTARSEWGTFQP